VARSVEVRAAQMVTKYSSTSDYIWKCHYSTYRALSMLLLSHQIPNTFLECVSAHVAVSMLWLQRGELPAGNLGDPSSPASARVSVDATHLTYQNRKYTGHQAIYSTRIPRFMLQLDRRSFNLGKANFYENVALCVTGAI